jgi:3-phosphoshikimate 1-carboxyvinyltransferase
VGRVRVPGDKSISHRAAMLAALCEPGGRTRVENFASSEDCASTLRCLAQLGVVVRRDGEAVEIDGAGLRLPRAAAEPLDCGNSGTTMRLLAGILAGQPFTSTLTGDESLRSRPMRRVIAPIELMGARATSEDGRAPLKIEGRRPLRAINYELPVASAQVKSCVLLAGLNAEGRTGVVERRGATRDHTERLLEWLGVRLERSHSSGEGAGDMGGEAGATDRPNTFSVEGGQTPRARDIEVPGDISSAAFLLVAASLLAGSDLRIERVGLNPTRSRIVHTLRSLGADIRTRNEREGSNEPLGDLVVRGAVRLAPARVGANVIRGEVIANLIDELPVLAVAGTRVEGGLEIRDAAELRVKETDRVSATAENLRAMGAEVEEFEDGLRVAGPVRLRGARVRSFGDHRIAMAFAVAALAAEGDTEIDDASCARISFPEFFDLLDSIAVR